jgi:hypothetical protein
LKQGVGLEKENERIEKYVKSGDGFWFFNEAVGSSAEIEFASIECRVRLAEIYDKINFAENNAEKTQ